MKKIPVLISASIALSTILGGVVYFREEIRKREKRTEKFMDYFDILDEWMNLKEEGKLITDYFIDNDYNTIAIYGMGKLGRHLCHDLEDSNITIAYGLDKRSESMSSNIKLLSMSDELPSVDVIIVTATFDFATIKEQLQKKVECPIISLSDVIYGSI